MKNLQRGLISTPIVVIVGLLLIVIGVRFYSTEKLEVAPTNQVQKIDAVQDQVESINIPVQSKLPVNNVSKSSITLLSPNGGERWDIKSTHGIKWGITPVNTAKVDLYLEQQNITTGTKSTFVIGRNVSIDKNVDYREAYNWVVGTDINNSNILIGQYTMIVCLAGSSTNCDSSNAKFSIVDMAFDNDKAPVINDVFGPTEVKVGEAGTWTVSASDPDKEEIKYNLPQVTLAGRLLSSGFGYNLLLSKNDTFSLSFIKAGIYSVAFQVVDKYKKMAEKVLTIRVD